MSAQSANLTNVRHTLKNMTNVRYTLQSFSCDRQFAMQTFEKLDKCSTDSAKNVRNILRKLTNVRNLLQNFTNLQHTTQNLTNVRHNTKLDKLQQIAQTCQMSEILYKT
jgi:hypothetical protein